MRSASPPQPGVHLGDDPDPATELGQRMAATAQTAQGLLTNYLFYGQRRQHVAQHSEDHDRLHDEHRDGHEETDRGHEQTRVSRRTEPVTPEAPTRRRPGAARAAAPTSSGPPRLHLRLIRPDQDDPLGADPMARDGLAEGITPDVALTRDGLTAAPVAPEPGAGDAGLSSGPRQQP